MDESILQSVKKLLGIMEDYTVFDLDIKIHINSALAVLAQLGVGPEEGFEIVTGQETWGDLLHNAKYLNMIQSYIVYKVRLGWDTPQNSGVVNVLKEECAAYESRISYVAGKEGI